jgi:biopolymer transport protein TolR
MKLPSTAAPRTALDLLPLLNVVLLLLGFFLLLARIDRGAPEIGLPTSQHADPRASATPPRLRIDADGALYIEERNLGTTLDAAGLQALQAVIAASDPVELQADAAAPAAQVLSVLLSLQRAGARDLRILTRPAQ